MILYKCDLCGKVVNENKRTFLSIGNVMNKDVWDICTECELELKVKLNSHLYEGAETEEKENEQNG